MNDDDNLPGWATPLDGINAHVNSWDMPHIAQAKILDHALQIQNKKNSEAWEQRSAAAGSNIGNGTQNNFSAGTTYSGGGKNTGTATIRKLNNVSTSHQDYLIEARRRGRIEEHERKSAFYTKICKIAGVFFLMAILFMISDIQGRFIPFKYKWIEFFAPRIVLFASLIVAAVAISLQSKIIAPEEK